MCRHYYTGTFIFILLLLMAGDIAAQDSLVLVKGKVIQDVRVGFSNLIVVDMRSGLGYPGNVDGTFEIEVQKNDEIMVYSDGYAKSYISLKDSAYKAVYEVEVTLKRLEVVYDNTVTIRPGKTLEELREEQEKIGSYRYVPVVGRGLSGLSSPFSLLYQMFSRREKDERMYVELLNEEAYKDALKSIIYYYISADLFILRDDEVETFIDYCDLNPEFVKRASLYEVGNALNQCYKSYDRELRSY